MVLATGKVKDSEGGDSNHRGGGDRFKAGSSPCRRGRSSSASSRKEGRLRPGSENTKKKREKRTLRKETGKALLP